MKEVRVDLEGNRERTLSAIETSSPGVLLYDPTWRVSRSHWNESHDEESSREGNSTVVLGNVQDLLYKARCT